MRRLLFFCVVSFLSAGMLAAETVPPPSQLDSRVREVSYVDGQIYLLRTGLTRATTIEFENGERIVSIVAGDTEAFNFESIPGDRIFAVKPTARSVQSNVTVYTNRRSYYFSIREGSSPFYVLRFTYPDRNESRARQTPQREVNNRRYGVSAANTITPTAMWDDGAFTYFQFESKAPIPAIFKVSFGLERSVNSVTLDNRIVRVSGISKQWALRLGELEVCIAEVVQ